MHVAHLKCSGCNAEYNLSELIFNCPKCRQLLNIEYDSEFFLSRSKRKLLKNRLDMWRYANFLPVSKHNVVSLGEGFTPLFKGNAVAENIEIENLYLKLDFLCPTGSFKDRGSSVLMSKSKELGVNTIVIDSSGNAASSISAYAAKAQMRCYVFIPAYASIGKIIPTLANGAKVIKVDGTRKDTYAMTEAAYKKYGWYYCGFQVNPYALEGAKTIAYEICEQLNWIPPDYIVFPVGTGSGLLGCWKGLKEMFEMKLISRMPKLVCVQAEGCSPIATAHLKKSEQIVPVDKPRSIAEGLLIGHPLKGKMVLNALRETKGLAEIVTDDQIIEASSQLAKCEGFFVEPSSAASIAGLMKLINSQLIDKNDVIVCLLTGSGLKTIDVYTKIEKEPLTIKPSNNELEKIII